MYTTLNKGTESCCVSKHRVLDKWTSGPQSFSYVSTTTKGISRINDENTELTVMCCINPNSNFILYEKDAFGFYDKRTPLLEYVVPGVQPTILSLCLISNSILLQPVAAERHGKIWPIFLSASLSATTTT